MTAKILNASNVVGMLSQTNNTTPDHIRRFMKLNYLQYCRRFSSTNIQDPKLQVIFNDALFIIQLIIFQKVRQILSSSNFNQYIPDSVIETKTAEEIQLIAESQKNGPIPKGNPILDLNLSTIEDIPSNIKFLSNKDNKLFK